MRQARVIVIGGGLAGIAAAVRLAEHHVPVTLVETRKRLGGRATSFTDPATGETLDNCQHVLMRCCTNLIDLYERLGVADRITWHRELYFTDRTGRIDRLEGDDLPAPLHLLRPLLSFRTLTAGEKLALGRGMLAVLQVSRRERDQLADRTFAQWLADHHQPAGAIEKFWSVVITSACNETPERVAASHALQVFQEAFLYDNAAYEMGVPAVPLVQLYDPAVKRLEAAGGEVMLGASADRFLFDGQRVTYLRLADRQELTGESFISTVPFDRLGKLVEPDMVAADGRLQHLDAFDVSPIVGIHLFLRRPDGRAVMTLPHLVLMQSPVQWLFNKSHTGVGQAEHDGQRLGSGTGNGEASAQHLHAVISAAHDLVDRPTDELITMAVAEVRRALPEARDAELVHGRVVKEKRATFAARPEVEALRPRTTGRIPNLYLAGDWVATGWPATMEGAVRSGYRAAAAVLRDRGRDPGRDLAADLPPSRLYRWMSG